MTTKQLKRVMSLLKEAYKQLRDEALNAGINIVSQEYDDLRAKARLEILTALGFTLEEYREAKAKAKQFSQLDLIEMVEENKQAVSEMQVKAERDRLSNQDIAGIAEQVAKEVFKNTPPQVVNKIVREIEKPTVVKETKVEVEEFVTQYDDSNLKKELASVREEIKSLPQPMQEETLKHFFHDWFSDNFKENINLLGMPDWRKLAMGLQAQIDAVRSTAESAGGFTKLTATGTVNSVNTAFTFTEKPDYIVSDGAWYVENTGWTWSDPTATMTIPPNDSIYGFT